MPDIPIFLMISHLIRSLRNYLTAITVAVRSKAVATRAHSYVGICWFLSISTTDVTECVTTDAFCALVWPQPKA
jgi:hypothetical protein